MLSCSIWFSAPSFWNGWWSWQPLPRSCLRCGWCHATESHGTPDDGRKTRLKHVDHFTEINKLWNIASCWLYSTSILAMHGTMNVKRTLLFSFQLMVTSSSDKHFNLWRRTVTKSTNCELNIIYSPKIINMPSVKVSKFVRQFHTEWSYGKWIHRHT